MEHNKSPDEKQLLSVTEVSELYHISKYTIRRFVAEGLPVVKSGRKIYINRNTFETFIKGGENHDGSWH